MTRCEWACEEPILECVAGVRDCGKSDLLTVGVGVGARCRVCSSSCGGWNYDNCRLTLDAYEVDVLGWMLRAVTRLLTEQVVLDLQV